MKRPKKPKLVTGGIYECPNDGFLYRRGGRCPMCQFKYGKPKKEPNPIRLRLPSEIPYRQIAERLIKIEKLPDDSPIYFDKDLPNEKKK